MADESGQAEYSPDVSSYLQRLYAVHHRQHACRATTADEFRAWQAQARPALCKLIALDRVAEQPAGFRPNVVLAEPEDLGEFTRQRGTIATEVDVTVPFFLLKPKGEGPFPLAVAPHGHGRHGRYAGVYETDEERKTVEAKDGDVALQAVKHGFLAIAPATRGIGCPGVPDVGDRHGGSPCRSQLMHCLLAGRTAIGERVWDMMRILDWALALPDVDAKRVLMIGNSGGGVVTTYAAACDERVTVAVPSCSFTLFVRTSGRIHHCDCNLIPDILRFGDMYDVAGLIAPRHLLVVNGRKDGLFYNPDLDIAVDHLRRIYEVAGAKDRFTHRYGPDIHRFYSDLMWPWITETMA